MNIKNVKIFEDSFHSEAEWATLIEKAEKEILPRLISKKEVAELEIQLRKNINWNYRGHNFYIAQDINGTIYCLTGYTGCASCGENAYLDQNIRVFENIDQCYDFYDNKLSYLEFSEFKTTNEFPISNTEIIEIKKNDSCDFGEEGNYEEVLFIFKKNNEIYEKKVIVNEKMQLLSDYWDKTEYFEFDNIDNWDNVNKLYPFVL